MSRDSHNYLTHEECSRALEARFGLRPVVGAFTRKRDTARPVAQATHRDWQAQERTGVQVDQVAKALRRAWAQTATGQAFADAVIDAGMHLALGRRGVVAVDAAGTPHSLARRLALRAHEVRSRLADIDITALPTVDEAKGTVRRRHHHERYNMTKLYAASRRRRKGDQVPTAPVQLSPEYWRALGYEVDIGVGVLIVTLSPTTKLEDCGDRITLMRVGEPTDEEVKLLVAACRARGWEEVRFFGGSPAWQKRARLEALRQGYRLDQISLECEDGLQRPPMAATPMPKHIRTKLTPPVEQAPAPAEPAPQPSATEPAPAYRP